LGGGGARGLAHVGVLKVLESAGIPVHVITGTSMGAIVGSLSAAGRSGAEIEAEVLRQGKLNSMLKLIDVRMLRGGLLKGKRIRNLLADLLGEETTFASLSKPLAVAVVDYNTGRELILQEGSVADAVRASMSVPGLFEPVKIGEYRLLDGGVLNNVPVAAARALGATKTIAVDVLPNFRLNQLGQPPVVEPLHPRRMLPAYRELWHVLLVMIAAQTEIHLRETPPDVLLRPDLPKDMDVLVGFERPVEAIAAGERAAQAALPAIQALLGE
jgi:NTE family protein